MSQLLDYMHGEYNVGKVQQRRAEVLGRLDTGSISKDEAQALLGLGRRQIDRMLADYRTRGLQGVVRGNAGKMPPLWAASF